jgi:hypothetical protein
LLATLHFQFATYGNGSQTTWRSDAFLNEAFIFIFAAQPQILFLLRSSNFYFPPRRNPATRKWQGGSVLVAVEIGDVSVALYVGEILVIRSAAKVWLDE